MTFIDNVLIVIVDSETKARDDPTAGLESLESVQRIDHVGAGIAGSGDRPPLICPA